jgi:hypothetical protein
MGSRIFKVIVMAEELKLAVELLKESGQSIQSWSTRLIAINAGLLSAIAVIMGLHKADRYGSLLVVPILALCFVGAVSSYFIGKIVMRQVAWNWSFHTRIKALQRFEAPILVPPISSPDTATVPKWVEMTMWLAVSLWSAAILGIVLATYSSLLPSIYASFCAVAVR